LYVYQVVSLLPSFFLVLRDAAKCFTTLQTRQTRFQSSFNAIPSSVLFSSGATFNANDDHVTNDELNASRGQETPNGNLIGRRNIRCSHTLRRSQIVFGLAEMRPDAGNVPLDLANIRKLFRMRVRTRCGMRVAKVCSYFEKAWDTPLTAGRYLHTSH
jgi:hypothetical protein